MRLRVLLICLATMLCASSGSAALVEQDFASPDDGKITRDSVAMLDWLDLTETTNFSYAAIEANAGGWISAGFRHATTSELCNLFATGAFEPTPCPGPFDTRSGNLVGSLQGLVGITAVIVTYENDTFGLYDDGDGSPYGWAVLLNLFSSGQSATGVTEDISSGSADPIFGHWMVRPATPLVDAGGSWQLNSICDEGAGGQVAGTNSFAFTEDTLSGDTTSALSGADCGSILVNGEIRELASCSQAPDPASSRVTLDRLQMPRTSAGPYFTYDVTFTTPFSYGALDPACASPPVERFVLDVDLDGTITDDGMGAATQIDGTVLFGNLVAYNTRGSICFSGSLSTFSCTFAALRNDVAAGPNQTVEPLEGATVTFTNVGTPGLVSVTRLTQSSGQIPANFEVADGLYYNVTTTADSITPPITVCLPYADVAPDDGFVDGTMPPVDESSLELGHDDGSGTFSPVTTSRDPIKNQVCGQVSDLSQFALLTPVASVPIPAPAGVALAVLMGVIGVWLLAARQAETDFDSRAR